MAYPVLADGTLGPGRQFAETSAWVKPGEGVAVGLKLDEHGNVFAAGPGGIHVFAPDGTRLGRIETGVPTGNLNWGEDGSVLYIAADHRILRLRTSTRRPGGLQTGGPATRNRASRGDVPLDGSVSDR